MRSQAQCMLRQHLCIAESSMAGPRCNYSCNHGQKSYIASRPTARKSSLALQTSSRHAHVPRAYTVQSTSNRKSPTTLSNPASLLSTSSPLNPSTPPIEYHFQHGFLRQTRLYHQNLRQQSHHQYQPHRLCHSRSRPFSTSSSSGPGSGSGPRLATFNQVRRGCRKEQRARIPVSPAMANRTQLKGVCLKVGITKPKKPNSGQRKIARVRLSTGKVVTAYIPGEGHNVQQHSIVLVRGGRAQDCPGVRYRLIRGALDLGGVPNRVTSRSKFGTKKPKAS